MGIQHLDRIRYETIGQRIPLAFMKNNIEKPLVGFNAFMDYFNPATPHGTPLFYFMRSKQNHQENLLEFYLLSRAENRCKYTVMDIDANTQEATATDWSGYNGATIMLSSEQDMFLNPLDTFNIKHQGKYLLPFTVPQKEKKQSMTPSFHSKNAVIGAARESVEEDEKKCLTQI